AQQLKQQASYLTNQQHKTMYVLFGGLAVLVTVIGLVGIIFTHKTAGPVYRMSLLHGKVGDGQLRVETGLRKGDELQDFFSTFVSMVDQLRVLHTQQVDRLEAVINDLEGKVDADRLRPLHELHQDMRARLNR
ncbi:MAG: hypothetical protein MUF54_18160, partial [Polyangiaceae bacterium]|nr:hypothetical protein [Polyangiaceae bacterium]